MKTGEESVAILLGLLNELNVPYMLVGSFSSNYYGVSRATRDADFVVEMSDEHRRELFDRLPQSMEVDPQISFETVTSTTRQIISIPSVPFKIELFDLSGDSHDQARFSRRRSVQSMGGEVFLPTPEDVIIQKLRWCKGANRGKDFDDCVNVLAVQDDVLDFEYIREWCGEHGTLEVLAEAMKIADC